MPVKYIPSRGDIVWLDFDPQSGHEQSGHRPALVISPKEYNEKVGLALFCPITSQIKNYPFEVIIPKHLNISGVILCDQIKSLDWKSRNAKLICKLPIDIINDVCEKIKVLIL
ncbi:MAG TPA: endoribonuclease MazF [bacterium]|nr:endoribonuclease MazF [bacterium]